MNSLSTLVHHDDCSSVPLRTELVSAQRVKEILGRSDVLAVVRFGRPSEIGHLDSRLVSVGLNLLDDSDLVEVWRGNGAVRTGRRGRIAYSENQEFMFGHLILEDCRLNDIPTAIEEAYNEIGVFLESSRYPNLFRIWNYIPGINHIESGLERYRAFCVGRYLALSKMPEFEPFLPAASAVGISEAGLLISFAASRVVPVQIENPRQLSAFHYPPVHGPRSPLFSRAVWMNWVDSQQLFLSGTASIVGHETQHADDVSAQVKETCLNIEAVLEHARHQLGIANSMSLTASYIRAYLRDPGQLHLVRQMLRECLVLSGPIIYLQGNLCRSGLRLEIEGVFNLAGSTLY